MAGRRLPERDDLDVAALAANGRAQADQRHKAPRRFDGAFSAFIYVLSGFICGAVFWHFIGFWSTFHDILVRGPARETTAQHHVAQWGPSCTTLVLDRQQGVTRAEPCVASSIEMAEAANYRRDRMLDRPATHRLPVVDTNWTVTIKDKPTIDASVVDVTPGHDYARPVVITPN